MKYLDLIKKIKEPVFSIHDLDIKGLDFYSSQLSSWVSKGLLIKLKNGIYLIVDRKNEISNEYIASRIYQPSYISLEWILARIGLIPEMVYNVTSITSRTSRNYKNSLGGFIYKHVKKEFFFDYYKIKKDGQVFFVASPEKALLDFLYLNSNKIKTRGDVEELRFNEDVLKKMNKTKIKKINKIMSVSGSKYSTDRVLKLIFKNKC